MLFYALIITTMKKSYFKLLTFFLISISMLACTSKPLQDFEQAEIKKIAASDLQEIVSVLSADQLTGRKAGTTGIEQAAIYLENELHSYTNTDDIKVYRDSFKGSDFDASNVFSFIPGTDSKLQDEVIIIGAHYDHIGKSKSEGVDTIANGANDNASGVSAALAIAKHFSQTRNNKRSILIALFSAEEFGLLGSKHLASNLLAQETQVYCMINFEMIGVPMQNAPYQAYITGFESSTMAQVINAHSDMNLLGFLPKAKEYNLFKRSDNYPIFDKFSVPAQTISTFDFSNYEYYHDVGDEADQLDYQHMADLINNLIPAIEKISQSKDLEIKLTAEQQLIM